MEVPDFVIGKILLGITTTICVLLAFWINTYRFIDEESPLFVALPDPKWFLLFCGTWGLFFIGGLMSFTLYHVYPHL